MQELLREIPVKPRTEAFYDSRFARICVHWDADNVYRHYVRVADARKATGLTKKALTKMMQDKGVKPVKFIITDENGCKKKAAFIRLSEVKTVFGPPHLTTRCADFTRWSCQMAADLMWRWYKEHFPAHAEIQGRPPAWMLAGWVEILEDGGLGRA